MLRWKTWSCSSKSNLLNLPLISWGSRFSGSNSTCRDFFVPGEMKVAWAEVQLMVEGCHRRGLVCRRDVFDKRVYDEVMDEVVSCLAQRGSKYACIDCASR